MELALLILQHLPLAVLVFDAQGRLRYGNEAAIKLWNLTAAEVLVGRPLQELLPALTLTIPTGKDKLTITELCQLLQPGRIVFREGRRVYCRSLTLPPESGVEQFFILLAETFDDSTSLACQIAQEERLAGIIEISNTLTHKLNQYLQVIMGYVSLLTLEIPEGQSAHDYLLKIMEQLENIRLTLHRLNNIKCYAVIERPDGRRMFDLDQAIANTDRHFR